MSSKKYASPLVLKPDSSRIYLGLMLFVHLGAMAVVIPLSFHWSIKFVLWIVLLTSLMLVLKKQGKGDVQCLTWKEGSDWALLLENGTEVEARLLTTTYVNPWLVVLNFKFVEDNRQRSVTLFRDALDQETFRRLRVRLGLEGASKD
jgi:hypothetical protein